MKKTKLAMLILTLVCILTACFGLTACGENIDFKINFVVDGTVYKTVSTSGGETIKMPENPTKDDYDFGGWFWDKDVWEKPFTANSLLDAPLSSDMSVYAKFTKKHEHSYAAVITAPTCMERGYTTYTCECGDSYIDDYVDELEHNYNSVITEPTCTEQGYTTHICSRCNDTFVDNYINALNHDFGEWIQTTAPTCTTKGVETRYCSHDHSHTETRPVNELQHNYSAPTYVWSADNKTCTAERVCSRNSNHKETETVNTTADIIQNQSCEADELTTYTATFTNSAFATQTRANIKTKDKLGHEFTNYVSDNNATYDDDGTKTAFCNHGCGTSDTITDKDTKLKSGIAFKTMEIDGNNVYKTIPYAQTEFDFLNEIEKKGNATYIVSNNMSGNDIIESKMVEPDTGDNRYYVLVYINGELDVRYTVNVYRLHSYTVSFNTNGGTLVENQQVEENSFAVEPTTTRTNYIFDGWDYDFEIPITKDTLITASWTVDLSDISFSNATYVYDGNEKTVMIQGTLPAEIVVKYYSNKRINAGVSNAKAEITDSSGIIYGTYNATLTVNKATVGTITMTSREFTYNGTERSLAINESLPVGVTVNYLNNNKTNAGTYQVVAKFVVNDNYNEIEDVIATLTINKANYDMTGVTFNNAVFTYDTNEHAIYITGTLPEGVSVDYYNNKKTIAGEYIATASFTGDYDNYNIVNDMTATLTINKATYDMTGISFNDINAVYDGTEKSAYINGVLPQGVSVSYENNGKTDVGNYQVTAHFTGDNRNYNIIPDKFALITISKATPVLNVSYNAQNLTLSDDIILSHGSDISGNITLDNNQTYSVGTKSYRYTYKPTDTHNYNEVKSSIVITIYAKVLLLNIDGTPLSTQYIERDNYIEDVTATFADNSGYEYTFECWTDSGATFNLDTQIVSDKTLIAKYQKTAINYTITYILNGGSTDNALIETYTVNDTVVIPSLNKTGYTFIGWSGEELEENTLSFTLNKVIGNRTYTANFNANDYTVTFNANGGDCNVKKITITYDCPLNLPETTKFYHIFDGWYYGEQKFIDGAPYTIAKNITIIAEWQVVDECELYTAKDLKNVAYYLDGNYKLMADINLGGAEWTPIGDETAPFTGNFNGNGHTVSNFKITITTNSAAFFGVNDGTIRNLNIINANITKGNIYSAILVGKNGGSISYCSSSGDIKAASTYVGGLVGYNENGSISFSSSSGNITANSLYIGGLVGFVNKTANSTFTYDISDCYSTAIINKDTSYNASIIYSGGLVGYVKGSEKQSCLIANSYAKCDLSISITCKSAFETYTQRTYVGGLIGHSEYTTYRRNYSLGTIVSSSELSCSRENGTVTYSSELYIGGFIGYSNSDELYNNYASTIISTHLYCNISRLGTSSCYSYVGGFMGYTINSIAANVYAVSSLSIYTKAANSTYSSNTEYIPAKTYSYVGGLVGYSFDSNTRLNNSFAAITKNSIEAIAYSNNVYHTEQKTDNRGGLIGNNEDFTISNCYRYSEFEGNIENGTATSLTNFKSINFIKNTLGWDDTIWTIVNGNYPSLDLYVAEE